MKYFFSVSILYLLASCVSTKKANVAIFSYSDFGPQVIASEIIGTEWWQWQSHGDSRPRNYDIKVVVYKGESFEWVKIEYPVNEEGEVDYRYLRYDKALAYLDKKIGEDIMDGVTQKLKNTRSKMVKAFDK